MIEENEKKVQEKIKVLENGFDRSYMEAHAQVACLATSLERESQKLFETLSTVTRTNEILERKNNTI